jgi:hypothetical protein
MAFFHMNSVQVSARDFKDVNMDSRDHYACANDVAPPYECDNIL